MNSVRLKHTAVENLISDITFINHDSLTKSNSEVPISGKQLEIIAVRFGFDKPVVNQYSFSNGQRSPAAARLYPAPTRSRYTYINCLCTRCPL